MKINSEIMNDLIKNDAEILKEKGRSQFLSFSLSLLSNKSTVVSSLINQLDIDRNDLKYYIKILRSREYLTIGDEQVLKRLSKIKVSDKNYDYVIQEIINDLNLVTKLRYTLTTKRKTRIRTLLYTYKLDDFKKVHRFFNNSWGSDPEMSQYLTPETLYNGKFEVRVEQCINHENSIKTNLEDLKFLYYQHRKMFEFEQPEKLNANGQLLLTTKENLSSWENEVEITVLDEEFELSFIPIHLQKKVTHWLKKYTKEDISLTISQTVRVWSKRIELIPFINLSKILDDKFPSRVLIAKKVKGQTNCKALKVSSIAVDNWSL